MNTRMSLAVLLLSIMGCATTVDTDNKAAISHVQLDFEQLKRRKSPNDYLVCPAGYCRNAKSDRRSPVLPISVAHLRTRLVTLLSKEPRTRILFDGGAHVVIEQRSAIFRFPDLIDIKMIELAACESTLAIYSRSKYGYYDFGANKYRIDTWLRELVASPK